MRRGRSARRRLAAIVAAGIVLGALAGTAGPALAQAVQSVVRAEPGDGEAARARLFMRLYQAADETQAREIEGEIWRHWLEAPDEEAASLMNEALRLRGVWDLAGARAVLDRLTEARPGWAEAWNQRATIRFMQDDTEGSLLDIEETLRREPKHFGAMAGQAIILMRQGRFETAQSILKWAVEIHPFLAERSMLIEQPTGERI
ncbi:tetratricopeptide repeat protein [Lutibaculum baratangense]|uniref:TPR domain protein n=1 Tax=Lutibaculum baratangense AMV1 TaxID=631454 RepID=V4TMM6_9HYPH|nr:TPR domain protein [Lutibaculum baratangense]ESR26998.1 TPR domain protein [Lutibaculum baratangense AMV1]